MRTPYCDLFPAPPGNTNLYIITVCKNDSRNLLRTIKSVVIQEEPCQGSRTTHFIMDGNSRDETRDILSRYSKCFKNVFHCSKQDSGIYQAMNSAIKLVPANSYVIFLNAGDTLYDQYSLIDMHTAISRYHGYDLISMAFGYAAKSVYWDICGFVDLRAKARSGALICQQSLLYNIKCFQGDHLFNEELKIAGDYDHLIALLHSGAHVAHFPRAVVKYLPGGISEKRAQEGANEIRAIRTARSSFFD